MQQKKFPMNLGVKIQLQCHEPIAVAKKDFDQLLYQVENIITSSVENPKK